MTTEPKAGFARNVFAPRYDVEEFQEDAWHRHAAEKTATIVQRQIGRLAPGGRALNAGAGVYTFDAVEIEEVRVDLFVKPLKARGNAVCADVQLLPFGEGTFDLVVCVGEVLGYCDPATALAELTRVLAPSGTLVCDFANSRGFPRWLTPGFGRAADVVTTEYNGTPERSWVYDPRYVESLLARHGMVVRERMGTHTWSSLARRVGLSADTAIRLQRSLAAPAQAQRWAELVTFVARRR